MKIYGNERTSLMLTELAQKAYNITDPIEIVEHDDLTYSIKGCIEHDELTEEDVNEALESLLMFRVKEEYWDLFGDADEDTRLDIYDLKGLARGWSKSLEEILEQVEICE